MNLPFSSSAKPHPRSYFFSLEIGNGILQTSIWTVENNKVQVLSTGTYEKYLHVTDFIAAADKSLSQSALSLKIDPTSIKRVILGLPSSWLSQERILPEKSKFLKEICQKLALKPIGFVVTAEAVIRYMQVTEGVPPTAVFIGISGEDLEISVSRLGKIVGIHTVKRGQSVAEDVKEGLSRFLPTDLFPSRILLYDHGVELEGLRQHLLSFPWQAPQHRLPFLHFPKIDVLPMETSIKAVSVTAGSEAAGNESVFPEAEESVPAPITTDLVDLGFVENVDLALSQKTPRKPPPQESHVLPVKSKFVFPKITLPHFSFPRLGLLIFFIPFIIALLGFLWWYFASVKIILSIVPQSTSARFTATASTKSKTQSQPFLLLKNVITDADTEINLPTTGTILIGDKATGSVTIVNGTNQIKTFSSGTELFSPSGLKFVVANNVTIASASGTADPNSYQPGKADVAVTASDIGQDSNLSAGTEFRIGSFSKLDFIAKNTQALSGGTSRQAQAVSAKDLTDAKAQADADLTAKSLAALKNSLTATEVLLPDSISLQTVSESTNHKIGEAADQLTLTRKIKASAVSYSQSDLDQLVDAKLSPQYSQNTKPLSSPKIEISFKSAGSGTYLANINATVDLAPDINTEEIVSQLLGKPTSVSQEYFSHISGMSNLEMVFKPKFTDSFKRFPFRRENISVFSTFVSP